MSEPGQGFGFAAEYDAPIPYMKRIREYYLGLGYGPPYHWRTTPPCHSSRLQSRWRRAASR